MWSSRCASAAGWGQRVSSKCYRALTMLISSALIALLLVLILLLVISLKSFGINREYQRAVMFRLGRLGETKGPGWYWLIPFVDRVVKVDQRIITYQLETQEKITLDAVAVRVNALLWFRAESPMQVVTGVENWVAATVQAAETALRDAIGQSDLDHMLKDRAAINQRLQQLLREASLKWGGEIDSVEIKDVDIPEQMQRAIAKEAEAIREKRARIIRAEGENEAAAKLSQAAQTIGNVPAALELRRLQTLSEIGVEHNTTIVAMLPVELIHAARKIAGMPEATATDESVGCVRRPADCPRIDGQPAGRLAALSRDVRGRAGDEVRLGGASAA